MDDVTPRLLKVIREEFQNLLDGNKKIASLYAKVRDGTATYVEANEFAIEAGEILANTFAKTLSSDVLPDGKMYYNIANRIIPEMMKNNHKLITDVTNQVQGALNNQAKIGIKSITPDINTDRIKGIVKKVSDAEKYDEVAWVLNEPIVNFSQSIVDDSIKVNAGFQYEAGLSPKIIRTSTGKCCDWCNRVEGVHDYEKVRNTGNNVFRRHRYCRCMVVFDPGDGKGKVQNVHSKKERQKTRIEEYKTREDRIQKEKESAKFKRTFDAIPQNQIVNLMRADSKEWIEGLTEEEVRCIQKYTLNEVEETPKFYERLNAMLRGEIPEDESLRYYANTISDSLKKSALGENVICYRGTTINPIGDASIGRYVKFNQFISTSVIPTRSFNYPIKCVIYAKKGTKGVAYIENISKMPKQRELLIDKDCVYKVLSNSKELVELEVI